MSPTTGTGWGAAAVMPKASTALAVASGLLLLAAAPPGRSTGTTAATAGCPALEVRSSPPQPSDGHYTRAPRRWARPEQLREQGDGGLRPFYHQYYCPNASSSVACTGAHFVYYRAGRWALGRRLGADPLGYHSVQAAAGVGRAPDGLD